MLYSTFLTTMGFFAITQALALPSSDATTLSSDSTTLSINNIEPSFSGITTSVHIATSAYYACNAPDNSRHTSGSSCKFYGGPSDSSSVVNGRWPAHRSYYLSGWIRREWPEIYAWTSGLCEIVEIERQD